MHLLRTLFPVTSPISPKEDRDGHEEWLAWQRAISEGWNLAAQSLLYVVQK
jgi:hypothetical protein